MSINKALNFLDDEHGDTEQGKNAFDVICTLRDALEKIADSGSKTNADTNVHVIWDHQKIAREALGK